GDGVEVVGVPARGQCRRGDRVGRVRQVDDADPAAGELHEGAVAGPGEVAGGLARERVLADEGQAAVVPLLGPTRELVGARDVALDAGLGRVVRAAAGRRLTCSR